MSLPNVNNLVDLINKTRLTEYDKLVKDTYLTSLDIIGNDIQYTYGNKQTKTFTLPVFKGASSDTNGTAGLVPAPPTEDSQNKYLRGDGTWAVISGSEEIVISETEPTSEDIKMWVNLTGDSGVNIPEVKDNEISEQDTWSSKKINEIINNGVNTATSGVNTATSLSGGKIRAWTGDEGGNFEIISPDGAHLMQTDIFDNNNFRIYFCNDGKLTFPFNYEFKYDELQFKKINNTRITANGYLHGWVSVSTTDVIQYNDRFVHKNTTDRSYIGWYIDSDKWFHPLFVSQVPSGTHYSINGVNVGYGISEDSSYKEFIYNDLTYYVCNANASSYQNPTVVGGVYLSFSDDMTTMAKELIDKCEGLNADTLGGVGISNLRQITQTVLNTLPTVPTGEGDYFVNRASGTSFPYQYGMLSIRYGSYTGEYVAIFRTTGNDNKIYYNTYLTNHWSGWQEISATPIKSTTFSGTTNSYGDMLLFNKSENKIPLFVSINDSYCIPLLSSSSDYYVHIINVDNTVAANVSKSGTLYYSEFKAVIV